MKATVFVVNYGAGNTKSVCRALELAGATCILSDEQESLRSATHIVLPGVGAMGPALAALRAKNLDDYIIEAVQESVPLLGICLGMQLLATSGTENGAHSALNLIGGEVRKLGGDNQKLPRLGWFDVTRREGHQSIESVLLKGLPEKVSFYFAHSFEFITSELSSATAIVSEPQPPVVAIVENENVIGTQFHPEKSGPAGLVLLENFLSLEQSA